mgnify:CR=1 FL=1
MSPDAERTEDTSFFPSISPPRVLCAHPVLLDRLGLSDAALMAQYQVVRIVRDTMCPPGDVYIMQERGGMEGR